MDTKTAIAQVDAAVAEGKLSPAAAKNIRAWLTEPYLAEYAAETAAEVAAGKWKELDDAFWTIIPFGTGGRRGKMHPIGPNAINDRTIGESALGLADYVMQQVRGKPLSCAIAYDTRHRSREFAELVRGDYGRGGLPGLLSRRLPQHAGVVLRRPLQAMRLRHHHHRQPQSRPPTTRSRSTGPQAGNSCRPTTKGASTACSGSRGSRKCRLPRGCGRARSSSARRKSTPRSSRAVLKQSVPGPRDIKIIYSPLHGVGHRRSVRCWRRPASATSRSSARTPRRTAIFPMCPITSPIRRTPPSSTPSSTAAKQIGADLILATDPDCDRLGCADADVGRAGRRLDDAHGEPDRRRCLTDSLLAARKARRARSTPRNYVVKTLVTTELMRQIADGYGVLTAGDLLVGFKYIGGEMDRRGPQDFVFGAEESYGFLAGDHVRDKDAAVASLLLCELAARLKAAGKNALRPARRPLPSPRLPDGKPAFPANAGRKGDGRHDGVDGRPAQAIHPRPSPA